MREGDGKKEQTIAQGLLFATYTHRLLFEACPEKQSHGGDDSDTMKRWTLGEMERTMQSKLPRREEMVEIQGTA